MGDIVEIGARTQRQRGRQPKRLRPWTRPHLREYTCRLTFDDGEQHGFEDWQLDYWADVFAGSVYGNAERAREGWLIVPEGNGKALALDTPIPTPTGWTEMGALEVGDELFDETGQVCRVTLTTPVALGHDCFRVVFSDGTSIVADADHLWCVRDELIDERSGKSADRIVTTDELAATHRMDKPSGQRAHRYSVPTATALDLPDVELPLDPYVLGAWLGDGTSAEPSMTTATVEQDHFIEEFEAVGHRVGGVRVDRRNPKVSWFAFGLGEQPYARNLVRPILRDLGVLGKKHIPAIYLRASADQRLALLQGLMDTDGCVGKSGQCTFSTIRPRLAEDFVELLRSLGLKASMRVKHVKARTASGTGPAFEAQFWAFADMPVCRLARKRQRQKARPNRRALSETRRIEDVIPVESVPVRCIQVDAPSHLYLAGDGMVATHNTTMFAGGGLYGLDYSPNPWIPVGASSRDQAKILYRQGKTFVTKTPGLANRFRCYDGYRKITSLRNDGEGMVICPWDPDHNDGAIPFPWALVDELHAHDDMSLYYLWKGKLNKRGGQILVISTAGEPGTEFEEKRDEIRAGLERRSFRGARLRASGRGMIFHEYMVRDPSKISDMREVKRASPLSNVTRDSLADEFNSLTLDLGNWKRRKCNLPTRSSFAAITEEEWERARDKLLRELDAIMMAIPEGHRIDAGLDLAWKLDTTALVPALTVEDGIVLGGPLRAIDGKLRRGVITPPRDGSSLHPDVILDVVDLLNARNPIMHLVMDVHEGMDVAARLEDRGITVVEWSQENDQKCTDYERIMQGLRGGTTRHTGDQTLRRHAMNAIALRRSGNRKRFDRPSRSRAVRLQDLRVIDALDSGTMVNSFLTGEPAVTKVPMVGVI